MARFLKLCFLVIMVLGLVSFGAKPTDTYAQGRTGMVLAHYYAWFDPSSFNGGKTPFTNPEPYFSTDRGVIQRHVQQAQSAGLDGFVQAWYGPNASQQTEPNFAALLDVAGASGFKAAVNYEPISPFAPDNNARIQHLQALLATHANHPAYLRMDGKPVVFFWATWALTIDDWAVIRNAADPNRNSIWIAEGGNYDYMSVFDGMYLYNIAWSDNPAGINIGQGSNTRASSGTYGAFKYWVATAMPGFNDSLLGRGSNTIVRDRGGGNFYRSSFSGAVQSNPDMIVITSFNEWPEGSHIEPSGEFGDFYLNLTRELVSTYKGGGVPSAAPVAPAQPAPTVATQSQETDPVGQATDTGSAAGAPVQIAAAVLPTPRADGRSVYVVQTGDTLIDIAVRFDILLAEIYSLNNITAESLLFVGQEIILAGDPAEEVLAAESAEPTVTPTPSILDRYPGATIDEENNGIVYQVAEGDTMIGIAVRYDIELDTLYELNGLDESSLLSVGQPVIIGYLPTPDSALRGGSADLPVELPTEIETPDEVTAEAALEDSSPTQLPIPTATATIIVPTVMPTAEEGSVVEPEDGAVEQEVAQVLSDASDAGESVSTNAGNRFSRMFVVLISISAFVLVLALGLFTVYLSRRT